jgi:hypothetical protein
MAAAVSGTGPSFAGKTNAPKVAETRDIGGAGCKKARICALVDQSALVVRSKGISAVTRPSVGVYCITPVETDPGIDIGFVTVDWDRSLGNNILAAWGSNHYGCAAGQYSVRTFALSGGTFIAANNVAFAFFVP